MKNTKRIRKRDLGMRPYIGQTVTLDGVSWSVTGEGGWFWWQYWELTCFTSWPRSAQTAARTFVDPEQTWPPEPLAGAGYIHYQSRPEPLVPMRDPEPDSSSIPEEEKRYQPDPALYSVPDPLPLLETPEAPAPAADHYSAPDPSPSFDPGPSMDSPSFDSSSNV